MKSLTLHIGHSKCASSTIQSFLSRTTLAGPSGDVTYICVLADGSILRGPEIQQRVSANPSHYLSSVADAENPEVFLKALRRLRDENRDESVIISNEGLTDGWANERTLRALDALNVPIKLFMLTRPPADWLNASWWQWGCWLDISVVQWVERVGHTVNYAKKLAGWRSLQNLSGTHVADVSQGPIDQMLQCMQLQPVEPQLHHALNTSSSADLLRFLIRNKRLLGRTMHNPTIEFELNAEIEPSGGLPPFVLDEGMIQGAIERSADGHAALMEEMHWNANQPDPLVVGKYLSPAAYEVQDAPFDLDTFMGTALQPKFLEQINEWLLHQLSKKTDPMADFNAKRYLSENPDVASAGMNPYEHYYRFGIHEGRRR